ncbi:MAG: hypothetical protein WKF43_03405 [Acidimicrobiales bacterium]
MTTTTTKSEPLEEEFDALFAQPPEDFVAARTALVRTLKATGRADDAARVKGWRRPSRPVWLLNRLALSEGDAIPELVAAATRAAETQAGGGAGLREAVAALRQATQRATRAAVEAIDSARPADRTEVAGAILAIVADPAALALLAQGRLLEKPESGMGAFGVATTSGGSSDEASSPTTANRARRGRPTPGSRSSAPAPPRREVVKAEAALRTAEEQHRRAVDGQEAADEALEVAAETLGAARAALREAEQAAETAAGTAAAAGEEAASTARAVAAARDARDALAGLVEKTD